MELKLPDPIKISKNIIKQLDNLEEKGATFGTFASQPFSEIIFYLYLMKKYNTNCIAYNKYSLKHRPIGLFIDLNIDLTKAIDVDKNLHNEFVSVAKSIISCVKNNVKTIIIPLGYNLSNNDGHATILIYRNKTNTLEHFEPHGPEFLYNDFTHDIATRRINDFLEVLNKQFKNVDIEEAKYIESTYVCPYIRGLQILESKSKMQVKDEEGDGYCGAWSLFFTELCLRNPELSSSEVLNEVYNYLSTKKNVNDYLKKIIRGYAGYIAKTTNKYLNIFFKGDITFVDVVNYYISKNNEKLKILSTFINVLLELELSILYNPNFNLKKELKSVKEEYNEKTKRFTNKGTKEEQRAERKVNYLYAALYYKKRILQNYKEYNDIGKVSEPIFETIEDVPREKIINRDILVKHKYKYTKRNFVKQKSPNSKTKKNV